MRKQWAMILALIVIILIAIFSVINVDRVEVNYLFGTSEWPLILVILFSVLLGGIMMVSVSMYVNYQLQQENKKLKKKLEEVENKKTINKMPVLNKEKNKELNKKAPIEKKDLKTEDIVKNNNSQK